MDVFKSNDYPENFMNNCFKVFLDKHCLEPLPRIKLESSLKSFSRIFSITAKYRVCLTNYETLSVLNITSQKNTHLVLFVNFCGDSLESHRAYRNFFS